jgi:hypothetical protein
MISASSNGMVFEDQTAAYPSEVYVCSDNNQRKTEIFLNPVKGTVVVPVADRGKAGVTVVAAVSERISESTAPTDLKYILSIKACNTDPTTTLFDPSYASGMLSSSGNWASDVIGTTHGTGRFGDSSQGWSAKSNNQDQWWQIDLSDDNAVVIGVSVKGRGEGCCANQYVKTWKFQYWDGIVWHWVDNGKEFTGQQELTSDTEKHVEINFDAEIITQKIRFRPWSWSAHISARMALRIRGPQCSPELIADLSICKAPNRYKDDRDRCVACDAGKVSTTNNAPLCMNLCAAGTYLLNGECVDMTVNTCPAGQSFGTASGQPIDSEWPFQGSSNNDGICSTCAPGFFKGETAPAACKPCSVGSAAGAGASSCVDCTPGKYNNVATGGVHQCKQCSAGTFGKDAKATSVEQCEGCYSGQYSSVGSSTCLKCPAGKSLKDKTGEALFHDNLDDCVTCAAYSYNPFPGLGSDCFPCLSAKTAGETLCSGCDPGKWKNVDTDSCELCQVGKFSNDRDVSACLVCPIGWYALESRPYIACLACSRGKYGKVVTSVDESACYSCAAGRFSEDFGLEAEERNSQGTIPLSCKGCPKGRWSSTEGIEKESLCESCAPGKYGSSTGGADNRASCTHCAVGRFSETVGAWELNTCTGCPSGFYIGTTGLTYCLPCQPGAHQPGIGFVTCDACAISKYTRDTKATECLDCPLGYATYGKTGSSLCIECAVGEYFLQGYCLPCDKGKYRGIDDDVLVCKFCKAGTFGDRKGNYNCLHCPPGKYQNAGGKTSCKLCAVGMYRHETDIKFATNSSKGNASLSSTIRQVPGSTCDLCPIGRTTNGGKGSYKCALCGAGKYGFGCKNCPVGTFRPVTMNESTAENPLDCFECPTGFFQPSPGQASCSACSPGKAQPQPRSTTCLFCPERTATHPGYFGKDPEMSACHECAEGTQAVEPGSTRCTICMAGTFGRHCSACQPGQYRSPQDTDSTRCQSCPAGYYQPEIFQASCLPCSPGLYQDILGSAECTNCASGQFSHDLRSSACIDCHPGTGTQQNGSAFCIDCARGTYAPEQGNGICLDCEANTFQGEPGMDSCDACPNGQLSKRAASECQLPAIVDPAEFPPPSPPTLSIVSDSRSSSSSTHNNNAVHIHWEYTGARLPDGFYVRLGTTRDFADSRVEPTVNGGDATSTIVVVDAETPLWLLKKPVYLQVSAFMRATDTTMAFQSEWSTVTEPWVLAHSCDDDEYLSTNHTTSPTLWHCRDCPLGASCLGPTIWDDVRPLAGFWRVPWNHSIFERCPFAADCLGYDVEKRLDNQTDSTTDGCILGTEGILCSQCSTGYNRDIATCEKCSKESLGYRVAILAVAAVVVYILFSMCRRRLKTKWRKYRPVYRDFIRICALVVTYSQINTSIPTMIDVPWPPEFVNFVATFNIVNIDIFSLIGVSCVGNFNFFISFAAMSTVPFVIALWAFVDFYSAKRSMIKSLAVMPKQIKKLEEEHALHMLYHVSDVDGQGTIDNVELSKLLIQLGWAASPKVAHHIMEHFHDDGTKEWTDAYGHLVLTEQEFVHSMVGKKMSSLLKEQKVMRVGAKLNKDTGEIIHTKKSRQETMLCDPEHLIRWVNTKRLFAQSLSGATMLALLSHTPVSKKVFQFFHCNNIGGREFLRADYSVECWSLEWWAFSPAVFAILFCFTFGLPGLIAVYLTRHRKNLYSTYVQQHIGWLYEPVSE